MALAPLQYDSLRTVIQYLEPNLRFKLSQRIPSLYSVEKAVPLKIEKLKLDTDTKLTVNETTYHLGIHRDYPGTVPLSHRISDRNGGQHDIDQWGFNDTSGQSTRIPGDVELPASEMDTFRNLNDHDQNYYERHLEFFQRVVEERLGKGEELDEIPEIGPLPEDMGWLHNYAVFGRENPDENRVQDMYMLFSSSLENVSIGRLQYNVQIYQEHLQPFYCRQNNTAPMFVPKLQLTVTSPGTTEVCQYNYTMKLHEAMKSLCIQFLGARRCTINVKEFDISYSKVLRLPVDLKFKIRELITHNSAVKNYECLKHTIDESSYPLDKLTLFEGFKNPEHREHQILESAKTLVITDNFSDDDENYLPLLLTLRNSTIEEIGSRFIYKMRQEAARNLIDQIRENIGTAVIDDLTVTIPMLSNDQLLVTCHEESVDRGRGWVYSVWTVKWEVVEVK